MSKESTISREEQIGFHKGSLTTLMKEREELLKMVQIVEQVAQAQIRALKELGVDLETQESKKTGKKSNLEHVL